MTDNSSWFEGDEASVVDASFKDYQITSTPNDFNVKTICDFIDSGVVKIPNFQRNYVWDLERASKLIESILIGLPIPQIFLYEQARNVFLVIDGQQRLMSIYYFVKGRFPKMDQRIEIRRITSSNKTIPAYVLGDDGYFENFSLSLPGTLPTTFSRFHDKNYQTLEDYQVSFNLSTIRNVIIKQTSPQEGDDSSVFEIFNRLNTGGVNLSPQEIRLSLYQSDFMEMLDHVSFSSNWLHLTGKRKPDINLKDTEILLRAFAMLVDGDNYREPMAALLNGFAKKSTKFFERRGAVCRKANKCFSGKI